MHSEGSPILWSQSVASALGTPGRDPVRTDTVAARPATAATKCDEKSHKHTKTLTDADH
jgi:hypothetical protein